VHQKGTHKGKINTQRLADRLGLNQATLHRILNGKIEEPDTPTIQRIHEKTGRSIAEIRGEAGRQEEMELTPTARAIATDFDSLPEAARIFTAEMIASILEFQRDQPLLAKLMFKAPDPKRHAEMIRRIEAYQVTHRERRSKS